MLGRVVLIEPHRRLGLAWGWGGERERSIDPGTSRVDIALEANCGATVVRLAHRDVPTSHLGFQDEFWEHHLPRLQKVASGEPVPPASWTPN